MSPEVVSERSLFGPDRTNPTHRPSAAAFAARRGEANRDRTATAR